VCVSAVFSLTACATPAPQTFSGATPLEWSQRLAISEMARQTNSPKWDYTMGLFTLSLLKLNGQIPDARFVKFSEDKIGSLVSPDGTVKGYKLEEFQLDAMNPGKTLLALWLTATNETSDRPWLFYACAKLVRQFETQPRTFDGGFWHKQRYTNQMWLDGIYMGAPFYAAMGHYMIEPQNAYDDVAKQFRLIDEHTYDAKTGLNYHGWDAAKIQPWANPATGCSSNFWGRAEGWYAMALVDVLDFLPTNHPARAQILATFQKTCAGIIKWQDAKTGLWWQVMDAGDRKGNYREATASAMFVYALAKGVNKNYLPREYAAAAEKGFAGIVKNLVKDDGDGKWSLTQCCSVAGLGGLSNGKLRDGSFDYYVGEPVVKNDLKGVGPFILAGIELQHLPDSK
jgi:unsaturated rhamnogalacturonyl hydrolase